MRCASNYRWTLLAVAVLTSTLVLTACGSSSPTPSPTPSFTPSSPSTRSIAAGFGNSCAVRGDGTVSCWGYNGDGQLGDGTTTSQLTPVTVVGVTDAVEIATNEYHSCALHGDGTISCWGANYAGQLGDGTTINRQGTSVTVVGVSDAVEIAAGVYHSCALLGDGTVSCWGENNDGQLGDGTTTNRSTPMVVEGVSDAVEIALGIGHSCALLGEGTVSCWGNNGDGQLGDGTTTNRLTPVMVEGVSDAVEIAVGGAVSCARNRDGNVSCWGYNAYGQLGDGTATTTNQPTPVTVPLLSDAVEISVGASTSCVRFGDGTVSCWGVNENGELGDGTTTDRFNPMTVVVTPITVVGVSDAVEVTTGGSHSCVRHRDGAVSCWGYNGDGQLGDGTTSNRSTPVKVVGIY